MRIASTLLLIPLTTGCSSEPAFPAYSGTLPIVSHTDAAPGNPPTMILEVRKDGTMRHGKGETGKAFLDELSSFAEKNPNGRLHLRVHPRLPAAALRHLLVFVERCKPTVASVTFGVRESSGGSERTLSGVHVLRRDDWKTRTTVDLHLDAKRPPLVLEELAAKFRNVDTKGRTDLQLLPERNTAAETVLNIASLARQHGFDCIQLVARSFVIQEHLDLTFIVRRVGPAPEREPGIATGEWEEIVEEVVPEEEVLETEISETEEVYENVIDERETKKIDNVFSKPPKKKKDKKDKKGK